MRALKNIRNVINTVLIRPIFNYSSRNVAYRSAVCLENLYPHSSLKLTTPSKPTTSQTADFNGYIPVDQLEVSYSRSSGPGGQNVNKVNTKVDVRFHLQSANWLSDKVKSKLLERYGSKLTKEGLLVFRSDITRYQQLNMADCLEKIRKCIREALQEKAEPSPETLDRIRKRIERANSERIAFKRAHGALKKEKQILNVEM